MTYIDGKVNTQKIKSPVKIKKESDNNTLKESINSKQYNKYTSDSNSLSSSTYRKKNKKEKKIKEKKAR